MYLNINICAYTNMSTYKIKLSKRSQVELEDSSIWVGDAEVFGDSATEIASSQDITVKVYFDDVEKNSVTVTDSGATLQFDQDASVGDHRIRVVPDAGQTDVCVDSILIDDKTVVMTQYDFNNKILGTTSTARQVLSDGQVCTHNYVWWGTMVTNDSSYDLPGKFYRPKIVSDHRGQWHWDFTKTSNNRIWCSYTGDTNDILYDSTAQHTYYACEPQEIFNDTAVGWGADELDSSSNPYIGPGTYDADLIYVDSSWDETQESDSRLVIISKAEYLTFKFAKWYHANYTVKPITIS